MSLTVKDRAYMREALDLAARARGCTSPNPMVGAVLVRHDTVVGRGYHRQAGMPHAEIEALEDAGGDARGATLYVNLEPCNHFGKTPPCTESLIEAGVARVVMAMVDPNPLVAGRGLRRLREAGLEVDCGILETEARHLNEAFVTFHVEKRPFVVAKWAMTLDGRTSTDLGDSRWISNEASRRYAHEIRAAVDAVAVGVGTVFFDNPRLNVRLPGFSGRQPMRVVFDGHLRTPSGARCLDDAGGECVILCTVGAPRDRVESLRKVGYTVLVAPGRGRIVEMEPALRLLAEMGVQSMLVEGGRQLHTALLQAGLVDKLVVFVGTQLIGGESLTSPLVNLGIGRMKGALHLKNPTLRAFGQDLCIEGYLHLPPRPREPVVAD